MRLVELCVKGKTTIDLDKIIRLRMNKGRRIGGKRTCRIRKGKVKFGDDSWTNWLKPEVRMFFCGGDHFTIECKSNDQAKVVYDKLQYLWKTKENDGTITPKEFFNEERN